jgi:NADH-quinone oxidoreductase subunit D
MIIDLESQHRAAMGSLKSDQMVVNMGPQHPSTHGVLRLEIVTDGEIVTEVRPHIGYLHRCFEKHAESMTYPQVIPYTDRMDYIASMNNNLGYAIAVEKMIGLKVPERVEYIRVIMAELNRIASHLIAIGTYGMDIGSLTPFFLAFREREKILDLFEMTCGARLLYNYIWVGGLSHDLPEGFDRKAHKFLDGFEKVIKKEYNPLLTDNLIFIKRTANVGILPEEMAINYGVTGPNLRGSGVKWDLRRDEPYSVYDRFDFDIPVGRGEKGTVGDCWDRYMVRIREMEESVKIVRQALDELPKGDVKEAIPKNVRVPAGEIYVRTETPRGELGYYLKSDGGKGPYRLKVRSPCFCNLSVIGEIGRGAMVADLIAIIGSIDIVLGEIDR